MFIVNLTYKVPVETVDLHLEVHREFVRKQYEKGNFVAFGRKVPRTGGIIFSMIADRAKIENILEEDPFKINGLADYEVIEFAPTRTHPELKFLMGE